MIGVHGARAIELALHSTSDFPNLLTGTGSRVMLDGYQASESALKRVCRQATANDFGLGTCSR